IGPRAVETLKEKKQLPGVDYRTTTLGGLDILDFIQDYDWVVFIDAIKTKNGVPGDVYEFTPADFKETLHLSNLHDISFLSAIELGKELDFKVPEAIHIFAIEIVEDLVFGEDFTPPVQERYEGIIEEIQTRMEELLAI
ncbi:MAG: hydrogenase maturation protease, partial [bacterium]|nr:hydrogenase maturation protease [bacterium]